MQVLQNREESSYLQCAVVVAGVLRQFCDLITQIARLEVCLFNISFTHREVSEQIHFYSAQKKCFNYAMKEYPSTDCSHMYAMLIASVKHTQTQTV